MFKVKRYISILLLVGFLPVLTPKEYIHDLFGHEDTHENYNSALTIDKAHKHCSILQVTFSTFVSLQKNFLQGQEFNNSVYIFPDQSFIPELSVHLSYLRGPPSYHF